MPGRSNPLAPRERERAMELLRAVAGRGVAIVAEEPLGSDWAPVTRLTLDATVPDVGDTVVLKTRRVVGGDWGAGRHLEHELAGLRWVAGLGVAPAIITEDEGAGVLVMRDLDGPTLEAILLGDDRQAATEALVALGDLLGRLHAATAQPVPPNDAERYGPWAGADEWAEVIEASEALGFPSASAAAGDVEWLLAQLRDPGDFLVLNHADVTPNNVICTGEGLRLVDFEGSGHRHAMCEASALHFPFPHYSAHWSVFPSDVVAAADAAYRVQLARRIRGADDDTTYARALAIGCGAELTVRVQRLPKLASAGQTPRERWRRRAQLVQQIDVFVPIATAGGVLLRLAEWFARLADAMRDRWDDASDPPPPLFPAFARGEMP